MLSDLTKTNIELAFHKAVRGTVARAPEDICDIAAVMPTPGGARPEERLVLITVSSFVFRLIAIFQVADCPETRAYYLQGAAERGIDEAFHEVANLCCGALNREFSHSFPHLAMSTPYSLDSRCIAYLELLRPAYLSHHLITINGAVRLRATLCLCCAAPIDLQLNIDERETTGELELF